MRPKKSSRKMKGRREGRWRTAQTPAVARMIAPRRLLPLLLPRRIGRVVSHPRGPRYDSIQTSVHKSLVLLSDTWALPGPCVFVYSRDTYIYRPIYVTPT